MTSERKCLQSIRPLIRTVLSTNKEDKQTAIEKLWDAFERLRSYHIDKNKRESTEQIISVISHGDDMYNKLFSDGFFALTKIGNDFRIRHCEMDRKDIIDENYYDYLFKRCFSLIELSLQCLKK